MVYLNEVSEGRKKKDLLFEERSDELLCPFFRGSSVALRGKCEALPPQDELILSRSEEAEQKYLKEHPQRRRGMP
ncbi:MAG: hypothetical protein U9R03_00795 [Candidatus Aerophobetes bacterium]|nr:hypothetical protein [Candidatus Aerophobetes bacterium]